MIRRRTLHGKLGSDIGGLRIVGKGAFKPYSLVRQPFVDYTIIGGWRRFSNHTVLAHGEFRHYFYLVPAVALAFGMLAIPGTWA